MRTVPYPCPLCPDLAPASVVQRIRSVRPFDPGRSAACRIDVVRCAACRLLRLDPRPADEVLAELQSVSREAANPNPEHPAEAAARLRAAGFPADGGRILDVGCGSGDLVAAVAERLAAEATGLDSELPAIERARLHHPIHRWVHGAIRPGAVAPNGFAAALMFHVLEHLVDPLDALRTVREWLTPAGLLLVEVPNGEFYHHPLYTLALEAPKYPIALARRLAGRPVPFTARGFYPYHLVQFGPHTLRATIEAAGFEVLGQGPATARLRWWVDGDSAHRGPARRVIDRAKLAAARRGLGDTLWLLARRRDDGASGGTVPTP